MSKNYTRVRFENEPSTKTPLSAENLNRMDEMIEKLDKRLISQEDVGIKDYVQGSDTMSGWSISQATLSTDESGIAVATTNETSTATNKGIRFPRISYAGLYGKRLIFSFMAKATGTVNDSDRIVISYRAFNGTELIRRSSRAMMEEDIIPTTKWKQYNIEFEVSDDLFDITDASGEITDFAVSLYSYARDSVQFKEVSLTESRNTISRAEIESIVREYISN